MRKGPPSSLKECVLELVVVIEDISRLRDNEERLFVYDKIMHELVAFRKLKEFVIEHCQDELRNMPMETENESSTA